jgi:hypothetical protein
MKILLIVAILLLPIISEAKKRAPASDENVCIANIGIAGSTKGVKKVIENVMYLKECLKYSSSAEVLEIAATMNELRGSTPRHFIAKIRVSEVPFLFTLDNFEYHIFQGNIVGVNRIK